MQSYEAHIDPDYEHTVCLINGKYREQIKYDPARRTKRVIEILSNDTLGTYCKNIYLKQHK